MSYSALSDISKLLPVETIIQLTDDEHLEPAAIDAENADHAAMIARIDEAIAMADAEIDGYCGAKYAVPLSPVPAVVKALSIDIAIYYLYTRRTIPEKIAAKYDKAIARLKDISRGLLTLGTATEPPPAGPAAGAETNKPSSDRAFTLGKMRGF